MDVKVTHRDQPGPDGELVTGHDEGEGLGIAGTRPAECLLCLLVGGAGMTVHHWIMAEVDWGLPRGQRIFWGYRGWGFPGSEGRAVTNDFQTAGRGESFFRRFRRMPQPPRVAAREPRRRVPGSGTAVWVKLTAALALSAMARPARLMVPLV